MNEHESQAGDALRQVASFVRDLYAVVAITVDEIQQRRPEWSREECRQFLMQFESVIQQRMEDAGTQVLDELLYEPGR